MWIFKADQVEKGYPQRISHLGLPSDLERIDAALSFRKNKKTYLFSGDKFWRLAPSLKTCLIHARLVMMTLQPITAVQSYVWL